MPFIRPNDLTVHYDFAGPHDAPVVLLANSLATNVHMWDEQINALMRKHRVLRYDMRGHGLTDTTPGADPSAASIERLVDSTMGRWFTEETHADRPELVRGFANMVRRTPKAGYLACGRAVRDADLRADDALIRARTLIVAGTHDPTASPAVGAEMRDAIAGAQLEVMHAAHILDAEQPVAFNELLLRFLEAA